MTAQGQFLVRLPSMNVPVKFLFDDKTLRRTVEPDTLLMEPHVRRIILVGRTRVELPRKFTRLREIVVESESRDISPEKLRYLTLADAVKAEARFR